MFILLFHLQFGPEVLFMQSLQVHTQKKDCLPRNCIFSGDERTQCGIIGGSIHESYSYCFFETNNECDSFTDLECDYTGDIIEELTNVLTPEECELMCKHNNCNYWVFESQDGHSYSCKFFNSKVGKVCFFI